MQQNASQSVQLTVLQSVELLKTDFHELWQTSRSSSQTCSITLCKTVYCEPLEVQITHPSSHSPVQINFQKIFNFQSSKAASTQQELRENQQNNVK